MKGHIEHTGRVLRTEGDKVFVAITSNSACSGCRAREACGVSESAEKIIEVETPAAADYAVGEEVVVAVRRHLGLTAVAIAYGGALLVLLAALFATVELLGWSEGAGIAATVAALALYYGALWLLRDKIAHTIQFTITKH